MSAALDYGWPLERLGLALGPRLVRAKYAMPNGWSDFTPDQLAAYRAKAKDRHNARARERYHELDAAAKERRAALGRKAQRARRKILARSPEWRAKRNARAAAYRATEAGKLARAAYESSPRGRAKRAEHNARALARYHAKRAESAAARGGP